jgi:hypothetical protein
MNIEALKWFKRRSLSVLGGATSDLYSYYGGGGEISDPDPAICHICFECR